MRFEAGKTYYGRSIGDADCIITATIERRTAKTVTAKTARGAQTFRVAEHMGVEFIKPWGSYSMAPRITAERVQHKPPPATVAVGTGLHHLQSSMARALASVSRGSTPNYAVCDRTDGKTLTNAALDEARARGSSVEPQCQPCAALG